VSDFSSPSIISAATAAFLAYAGIAGAIGLLKRRALAKPNQRSSHTTPTPQGGGVVVVPAALVSAGIALALSGSQPPGGAFYLGVVATAALTLTIIGFIDDMRALSVASRLVSQTLAVAVAVALMPADFRIFPPLVPLPLERALLICAGLWFVNLFNFMDGIDLISAAETTAIALGILILAGFGITPVPYGIVALALIAAMAGFAPWNWPPARVFLGDAGSIPIGFMLAVLLIHLATMNPFAAAIMPLYYLADATITLGRRIFRGERVWEAHRQHFYQQATANGFTVMQTVRRIALLDALLIALAVASAVGASPWIGIVSLIAAGAAVGWTLRTFARGPR
jgi:UDP-N-acetylmuramyl pentapeptide phosphotransferase/UDP-N-acetylglucosamine-1-phosphate transferase